MIKNRKLIHGFYGAFAPNISFTTEEQKEIMITLLDMTYEKNGTFYIGNSDNDFNSWEELFQEFDLSELNLIITEPVNKKDIISFIKDNQIKPLITDKVNFKLYKKAFEEDLENLILGSHDSPFEILDPIK